MKFAIVALLATTSAIRIANKATKSCVTKEIANEEYNRLDTNHNGSLSYGEIESGLR